MFLVHILAFFNAKMHAYFAFLNARNTKPADNI